MKSQEHNAKMSFQRKNLQKFRLQRTFFSAFLPSTWPPSPGDREPCSLTFLARRTILIENFQLFFHKLVSNLLKMGPKIALSKPKFKNFLRCPTMVGNVNLLRYFASSLQPLVKPGTMFKYINQYLFSKTTQIFSHDAKREEEFSVNHVIRGENWCNIRRGGS